MWGWSHITPFPGWRICSVTVAAGGYHDDADGDEDDQYDDIPSLSCWWVCWVTLLLQVIMMMIIPITVMTLLRWWYVVMKIVCDDDYEWWPRPSSGVSNCSLSPSYHCHQNDGDCQEEVRGRFSQEVTVVIPQGMGVAVLKVKTIKKICP